MLKESSYAEILIIFANCVMNRIYNVVLIIVADSVNLSCMEVAALNYIALYQTNGN